jgi:hypothetical protein
MRTILRNGLVLAAVIAAPVVLPAQSSSASHPGLPWVGCWEPVDGLPGSRTTCVAPEGASALKITTIGTGGSLTESTLQIDGERHEIDQNDCRGWESARASKDGDRIIIDGEITCSNLPKQKRAGAFVITPNGDWLHIEGAGISRVNASGVRRYRQMSTYLTVPMQLRDAVTPWLMAAEEARYASMDASLSAKDLIELEQAEVPVPIIDVLVASAHPQAFALEATTVSRRPAYSGIAMVDPDESFNRRAATAFYANFGGWPYVGMLDPFFMYGNCGGRFGYSTFDSFCYSPFGLWGSRYGFNGYGWGGGFGGWGGIPVTVVPVGRPDPYNPSPSNNTGGRNVRGRGYTPGGDNSGGTATPRSTAGNAGSGSSNSGGGSSAGGAASSGNGSSAGSSGSTPRTAKPRKP